MTSRERLRKALRHEEPDHVPFDMGGTQVTGIAEGAYLNMLAALRMEPEKIIYSDVVQQLAQPSEKFLDRLEVDTRGLFPLTSHNHNIENNLYEDGNYMAFRDEWGMIHHMPKQNGYWFSIVHNPMADAEPEASIIDSYAWPAASDKGRIAGLKTKALAYREKGKAVVVKSLCAGIFEMTQRIRGMEHALMDPMMYPEFSDMLIGKLTDLKIEYWDMVLSELHDVIDVVMEADDYGSQTSQLIAPEQFRSTYKPHIKRLISFIKSKAPDAFVFFHSCGNVRPFIPDFIEVGIDILNPVHISATGMDPFLLKKDFGKDICFWGGGVETQDVLPNGTPQQIRDNVKRNIDALAPGGGFVFNTVHNIQREVPAQNVLAMWEAWKEFGKY